MSEAVAVLQQEIANLEQEINKRSRALAALTGPSVPMKSAPVPTKGPTPAVKKSTPAPAKSSTPPRPAAPVVVTLGERILAYLSANKGKSFAPVEIAKTLAVTDKNVKADNVQRRLGDLFKSKRVKRDNGRYSL
ncbi:MAG: hypothetical protein EXR78_07160 [Deltaproteobacteria bacterium]|nr:hypothetical protein [Deltaproteobacteria bacterium]